MMQIVCILIEMVISTFEIYPMIKVQSFFQLIKTIQRINLKIISVGFVYPLGQKNKFNCQVI